MAQLIVRNLPDDVKERLKRRAKLHGRSLEAEARAVLAQAPEVEPTANEDGKVIEALVDRLKKSGVRSGDIDALNESMANSRRDLRLRDIGDLPS